jgi:hypothetical protein
MDGVGNWIPEVAAIDIIAVSILVMGAITGILRGLGPVFGMLLWLMASLWLGSVLTPVILGWMPNSPSDASAQLSAFGLVSGVLLVLPALARLLGGAGGKKKKDPVPQFRPFGVLVGLVCACIFFTLLTPYAHRVSWVSANFQNGSFPVLAREISDSASWLFPTSHRNALQNVAPPQASARNRR